MAGGVGATSDAIVAPPSPPATRECFVFGPDDWAWEFLRRSPDYLAAWWAAVPRRVPHVRLADKTYLLRLRRRYPQAERFGLYAFADPAKPAGHAPIFWLVADMKRLVKARCIPIEPGSDDPAMTLAAFKARRLATIAADGTHVVTIKRQDSRVALKIDGLPVLTRPFRITFELDGLDQVGAQTEALKTLERLAMADTAKLFRSPFADDERLRHALIALDLSMAGKTYRQIAIALFGEETVAKEWQGVSQFLKDRTRRLVAKGRELMNGGYRDLLT